MAEFLGVTTPPEHPSQIAGQPDHQGDGEEQAIEPDHGEHPKEWDLFTNGLPIGYVYGKVHYLNTMNDEDRIGKLFQQTKAEKRAAFIGYVCAGDPDFETSLSICRALVDNGVDLLELGVPFSDPLADGLTNQLAAQRALSAGCRREDVFRLVREIRAFSNLPIVLYTYYNLVFSPGVSTYVEQAREAGVDGLLTLDLPPEEAGELLEASKRHGMKNVFIVAPTTPADRIKLIADSASGFLYYVSREGVTGERADLAKDMADRLDAIRAESDLPLVVGFGISSSEQAGQVATMADGVVVGSALVNCITPLLGQRDDIPAVIGAKAAELLDGIRSVAES